MAPDVDEGATRRRGRKNATSVDGGSMEGRGLVNRENRLKNVHSTTEGRYNNTSDNNGKQTKETGQQKTSTSRRKGDTTTQGTNGVSVTVVVTEIVVVETQMREVGELGAGVWVEDSGRAHLPPFPFDEEGGEVA